MSTLPLFENDAPGAGPGAADASDTSETSDTSDAGDDGKTASTRRAGEIRTMLMDPSKSLGIKLEVLRQLARSGDDAAPPILAAVLEAAANANGATEYREKILELGRLIEQMQQGPLRCALFDRMLDAPELGRRAQVILPDGTLASPLVPDGALAEKLRCGDTVWIEAKGGAIVARAPEGFAVGDEATLEQTLPSGHVRARVGELGRSVYRISGRLEEQIAAGEAKPGSTLVVCPRRAMAFSALPEEVALTWSRFLCKAPVPDVVAERDLGEPPRFIARLLAHLRRELADPGVSRRHGLRRSRLHLLAGIPGSGKTIGIEALWNGMYGVMSEATGVPVEALPHRVMRLRSADVLSKWLGQSDKLIARFFEEVEQLAAEPWEDAQGRLWELPVLVIAEEIDGLARHRGEDGVHDRILTTLLEGLDPARPLFRDRLVFFLATTNASHLVDMAVIRRIGGRIERFGHLGRRAFAAVLAKQLERRPFAGAGHIGGADLRRRAVVDITSWLHAPSSTAPVQVELTFVGQATPTPIHHRDFLTAGLVDRAIQDACEAVANREHAGEPGAGLDAALVVDAIHRQVRSLVDLLTPANCGEYLSLPDGERVATLRRIEQPAVLPFALERGHDEGGDGGGA